MPTFQIFSNGIKVGEMSGADPEGLKKLVDKYYVKDMYTGQGRVLGLLFYSFKVKL